MSTDSKYPQGIDTETDLPNITHADRMDEPGLEHDVQHTKLNQAVRALQTKVGADESEDGESHDFRIRMLEAGETGGAGLELGDDGAVLAEFNEALEIPAHPSNWLLVEIAGTQYVVPGFKLKELEPLEEFEAGSANLYRPIVFRAHEYIRIEED